MLGPLPALLSDQMVGEISGQTSHQFPPPSTKTHCPPLCNSHADRTNAEEREANDLLASNVNEGHAVAGLQKFSTSANLSRVRTEQPAYISRYCAVASR